MAVSRRLFAASACAAALTPAASYGAVGDALDGLWQGALTPVEGSELLTDSQEWQPFRIIIDGAAVQVFLRNEEGGAFEEIKPGAFVIRRVGNSAIVSAIDASPRVPVGQGWVESWSFALTLKEENVMTCLFMRQVNNHQLRHGEPGATFSVVLTGELQRVPVDHV